MSKKYTQLSLVQRYLNDALVRSGMKQKMIAAAIGVDPSTVSREYTFRHVDPPLRCPPNFDHFMDIPVEIGDILEVMVPSR